MNDRWHGAESVQAQSRFHWKAAQRFLPWAGTMSPPAIVQDDGSRRGRFFDLSTFSKQHFFLSFAALRFCVKNCSLESQYIPPKTSSVWSGLYGAGKEPFNFPDRFPVLRHRAFRHTFTLQNRAGIVGQGGSNSGMILSD